MPLKSLLSQGNSPYPPKWLMDMDSMLYVIVTGWAPMVYWPEGPV